MTNISRVLGLHLFTTEIHDVESSLKVGPPRLSLGKKKENLAPELTLALSCPALSLGGQEPSGLAIRDSDAEGFLLCPRDIRGSCEVTNRLKNA